MVTEVQSSDPRPLGALSDLLVAAGDDAVELAESIRAGREQAMVGTDLLCEVYSAELRFLRAQAAEPTTDLNVRAEIGRAERAGLDYDGRSLVRAGPDDGAALFDLAELAAALRVRGMQGEQRAATEEIARRLAAIEVDEALEEEARERYVALSTEEEDLDLPHKIALLEETASVLLGLAERSGRRSFRRLGKRLGRLACDRVLARRVEQILSRRGATILETTSLLLLVALLLMLLVESVIPLGAPTLRLFLTIDIGICLFFVAEFAFKLALAPVRMSWFLRHVVTDLLPALPAALLFLNVPHVPSPSETAWVRALRFLRIAYFARYIQALRPILRLFRLLLFMVRGLDYLVARFSWVLNRDFVFFEPRTESSDSGAKHRVRPLVFRALHREHVLLREATSAQRGPVVAERARRLGEQLAGGPSRAPSGAPRRACGA